MSRCTMWTARCWVTTGRPTDIREIKTREGTIFWSDELALEEPLLSPIDVMGPGVVRAGVRISVRLTAGLIGKITARTAARGAASAGPSVIARLRLAASNLAARIAARQGTRTLAQQAEAMVAAIRQAGNKVVVNLGATVETPGAINVNPLRNQQVRSIPNMLRAAAEQIGSIFRAGSVDKVVSNNIVRGQVNWAEAARGAFHILKPGGEVSIAPFAGQLAEHLGEITVALRAAGFQRVQTVSAATLRPSSPDADARHHVRVSVHHTLYELCRRARHGHQ